MIRIPAADFKFRPLSFFPPCYLHIACAAYDFKYTWIYVGENIQSWGRIRDIERILQVELDITDISQAIAIALHYKTGRSIFLHGLGQTRPWPWSTLSRLPIEVSSLADSPGLRAFTSMISARTAETIELRSLDDVYNSTSKIVPPCHIATTSTRPLTAKFNEGKGWVGLKCQFYHPLLLRRCRGQPRVL